MRTSEAPRPRSDGDDDNDEDGADPDPRVTWVDLLERVGDLHNLPLGNDSRDQTRWTSRGLLPAFSSPPWGRSALRVPERASVASNHSQRMNQVRGRWPRRPVVSGQSWQAPAEAGDPHDLGGPG